MEGSPIRLRRELRPGALGASRAVYWLDIARPETLNALSRDVIDALAGALDEIEGDSQAHVVILSGSTPRAFVGGADVDELAALDAGSAVAFITRIHELCDRLRSSRMPVVAVIRGFCLGAGLELACSCDLRLSAEDARFGMPEVHLGIPSVIEAALLPRFVGSGRARDLVLTGRLIGGGEAQRWGLVETAVPAEKLDEVVESRLGALLAACPEALRLQKRLCRQWEELPLTEGVAAGIAAFGEAWEGDEPSRALEAFLEQRLERRRRRRRGARGD